MHGNGIVPIRRGMRRRGKMIYEYVEGLIKQGLKVDLIEDEDEIYVRNQVLSFLRLESFPVGIQGWDASIPDLLEKIVQYGVEFGLIDDIFDEKEMLAANLMNCFVPMPSVVNRIFKEKYQQSPNNATDYFYHLSQHNHYIQVNRIAKNITFQVDTAYGQMDITINMSKPEKDPEQIKRERDIKTLGSYPKCLLCIENEGYSGKMGYPARANHRIIHLLLNDESWYLQYSPYAYYNEHCIVLAKEHRNMKIDRKTFERLLSFVSQFPHYFLGSNADLPIVGGSILSHDHYQGGNYEFAMTKAEDAYPFELKKYPEVKATVLKWPMSVIRLRSANKDTLIDAADHILQMWKGYSDQEANVVPYTGKTPHNTVTPIARVREGNFELDLVLRNNRTTIEHPLGIFHPHADVHHIKKENIGLIEVMGLAVLPPRLRAELWEIRRYLSGLPSKVESYHMEWAEQMKSKYRFFSSFESTEEVIYKELGKIFVKCLEDAGVLKTKAAFTRFIHEVNQ